MINLYQGNCLKIMKQIPDKGVDMILCDLPYGVTARSKWDITIPFDDIWESYKRVIKDNGAIVLFSQGMFTALLMLSNCSWWRYNLVWKKTQPTGFLNAKRMPLRNHEDICVFYKTMPIYNPQKTAGHIRKISTSEHKRGCKQTTDYGKHNFVSYDSDERYPLSVVTFPKDTQKEALHPTQKPIALCEYLIRTYTNEGDLVLDNCMGSGSTGVACINTNRSFIGIELDEHYFEIAKKRLKTVEKEVDRRC
jgi:site-specific DNA-methyltransferase (adenine-specific)